VDNLLDFGSGVPAGFDFQFGRKLCFSRHPRQFRIPTLNTGIKPSHKVTFSMGHVGASGKSPNDAPWETLSLRLSSPISIPFLTGHLRGTCTLLTAALSWRYEEEDPRKEYMEYPGITQGIPREYPLTW